MADPKDISIKISADITQLNNSLNTAARNIDNWSKGALGGFTNLASSLATLGARFAVATAPITALVAGLAVLTTKTANAGDELLSTSQKVGVSVEKLSALQYAAKLSNLDVSELATGLRFLSKNITETGAGTGEAKDAFAALSISVKDVKGSVKPTSDILLELADKFADMEDGAGKTALAMRLFGRNGAELIPFLNKGAAGINELTDEAKRLGIVFTQDAAEAANKFNDNLKKTTENINGLIYAIGNTLMPVLNAFIEKMQEPVFSNKSLEDTVQKFEKINQINKEMAELKKKVSSNLSLQKTPEEEADIAKLKTLQQQLDRLEGRKTTPGKAPEIVDHAAATAADRNRIDAQLKIELEGQKLSEQQYLESYKRDEKNLDLKYAQGVLSEKEYQQEKARLQEQELLLSIAYSEYEKKQLQEAFVQKKWLSSEEKDRIKAEGDVKAEQLKKDEEISKAKQDLALLGIDVIIKETEATKKLTEARLQASEKILESQIELKKQRDAMAVESGALSSLESKQRDIEYERELLELKVKNLQVEKSLAPTLAEKESKLAELITLQDKLAASGEKLAAVNLEISGSFGQGWEQGIKKWVANIQTAFEQGVTFAETTAQAMSQAFSDFFFDVMTGKAKSFQEYFKSFANAILSEISRILAAQVTAGIIRTAVSIVGTAAGGATSTGTASSTTYVAHSGGLIMHQGGYVPRFHIGGLSSDERPAILQTGEGVLSRRGMAALGTLNSGQTGNNNNNNNEQQGGSTIIYNNITAIDTQTFAEYIKRNPGAITNVIVQNIKTRGEINSAIKQNI